MVNKIIGTRIDCTTGEKRQVELEYEIIDIPAGKLFKLHGGPTGFEGFYIKNTSLKEFEDAKRDFGNKACWVACMGDVGYIFPVYDRLVISAEEMIKALTALGTV